MRNRFRTARLLLAAVAAVMALGALAASASASVVPAYFSGSSFKVTAPSGITLKRSGTEPKVCTPTWTITGSAQLNGFTFGNVQGGETKFTCPSGTSFTIGFVGEARYDTVTGQYSLYVNYDPGYSLVSPWGSYYENSAFSGAWVNGSGSTPSTLTYTNAVVGHTTAGAPISIEGTLNVTTSTGGLLTLSH